MRILGFGKKKPPSKLYLLALGVVVIIIGCSSFGFRAMLGYINAEQIVVATVESLHIDSDSPEQNNGLPERYIKTDKGIFIDEPDRFRAKYESTFLDKLKPGETYEFKLSGRQFCNIGSYPNILGVKPVGEGGNQQQTIQTTESNAPENAAANESTSSSGQVKPASETEIQVAENFYNAASISMKNGEYEKAVQYYEKALEILPDNQNIKMNLELAKEKLASQSP